MRPIVRDCRQQGHNTSHRDEIDEEGEVMSTSASCALMSLTSTASSEACKGIQDDEEEEYEDEEEEEE